MKVNGDRNENENNNNNNDANNNHKAKSASRERIDHSQEIRQDQEVKSKNWHTNHSLYLISIACNMRQLKLYCS